MRRMRYLRLALLAALGGDPLRGAQLLGYEDAQYDLLGMQRHLPSNGATTSC